MAIEDLRTKLDLERFVEDQLRNMPASAIGGLPEALAARTVERFELGEDMVCPISPAEAPIPGCEFKAPSNMTALALATVDSSNGLCVVRLKVNGVAEDQEAIGNFPEPARGTVSQNWPLILKKDDVVQLHATGLSGGTIRAVHTGLTILRLT